MDETTTLTRRRRPHSPEKATKAGRTGGKAPDLGYDRNLRYLGKERYYLEQNFDMASLAITDLQPESV